ncbi:hypothetical protein O988_09873, partial [Pseudogymnoascus sp. VKM F-3808]
RKIDSPHQNTGIFNGLKNIPKVWRPYLPCYELEVRYCYV